MAPRAAEVANLVVVVYRERMDKHEMGILH